jgi:hypothetical protein
MPELTPEQNQAFARVLTHADRLFEALEDLEAAGGLCGLSGRLRPASLAKAAAGLRSVRQAIDEQLAGLKGARPGPPGRDAPLPTGPPPAAPRPLAGPTDSVPIRRTRDPGDD